MLKFRLECMRIERERTETCSRDTSVIKISNEIIHQDVLNSQDCEFVNNQTYP